MLHLENNNNANSSCNSSSTSSSSNSGSSSNSAGNRRCSLCQRAVAAVAADTAWIMAQCKCPLTHCSNSECWLAGCNLRAPFPGVHAGLCLGPHSLGYMPGSVYGPNPWGICIAIQQISFITFF